ncbi:hypothetical protein H5410_002114 [Solanum commersonii]|uniref:Uncharacterized protein n=1 Tax=Solanum commersonii TaxID=4109 RepID=A0A9J6B0R3_SOLCO|nr:hypothetical protein H5410_002114 [Solanum commersonii]
MEHFVHTWNSLILYELLFHYCSRKNSSYIRTLTCRPTTCEFAKCYLYSSVYASKNYFTRKSSQYASSQNVILRFPICISKQLCFQKILYELNFWPHKMRVCQKLIVWLSSQHYC